jgi:hypothetical protein
MFIQLEIVKEVVHRFEIARDVRQLSSSEEVLGM